jgi:hypothetical protein
MNITQEIPTDRRRFTTLEGWRDVGRGVYLAPGSTVASVAFESTRSSRFDPEWDRFDDNDSIKTRLSKAEERRRTFIQAPSTSIRRLSARPPVNPFSSPEDAEVEAEQPVPHRGTQDDIRNEEQRPRSEQPFHIFNKRQKWFLVVMIGMAGLFSGLSSNIYFPSLDAIARVQFLLPLGLVSHHVSCCS